MAYDWLVHGLLHALGLLRALAVPLLLLHSLRITAHHCEVWLYLNL